MPKAFWKRCKCDAVDIDPVLPPICFWGWKTCTCLQILTVAARRARAAALKTAYGRGEPKLPPEIMIPILNFASKQARREFGNTNSTQLYNYEHNYVRSPLAILLLYCMIIVRSNRLYREWWLLGHWDAGNSDLARSFGRIFGLEQSTRIGFNKAATISTTSTWNRVWNIHTHIARLAFQCNNDPNPGFTPSAEITNFTAIKIFLPTASNSISKVGRHVSYTLLDITPVIVMSSWKLHSMEYRLVGFSCRIWATIWSITRQGTSGRYWRDGTSHFKQCNLLVSKTVE